MKIAFLNQKGGVGKTSLSVAVAAELARRGGRVLLVDADPQGSALDWSAEREKLDPAGVSVVVVGIPRAFTQAQIDKTGEGYDHIIIDGPARVSDISPSAAMAADVVIVPVTPSAYDVWASEDIIKIIEASKVYRPNLKAAFLLNRKISKTSVARDVYAALGDYPIPVLDATITQRVIFSESAAKGRAVFEIDQTGPATREIETLVNEILEMSK